MTHKALKHIQKVFLLEFLENSGINDVFNPDKLGGTNLLFTLLKNYSSLLFMTSTD